MYDTKKPVNHIMVPTAAFQSLSFRGKRGYSNKTFRMKHTQDPTQKQSHAAATAVGTAGGQPKAGCRTYGGILKTEQGKYALVQGRYTGKWSFPKGHANPDESPLDCSMREIAEETSITQLPKPTTYIKIGYGSYFIFNLIQEQPLVPSDTHEIMDTRWVTLEEMEQMSVNADVSIYLRQQKQPT